MVLELLILAVLCSSTQGMYRYMYIHTKIKPIVILIFLFILSGRLVQVSGNEEACSNDTIIFWCTSEVRFLNWEITRMTGESSRTRFSLTSNTMKVNLTQDISLVAQVTFINGSFINGTVKIMGPSNLNGGMIRCNMDILALNIPSNIGKFLVTGIGN